MTSGLRSPTHSLNASLEQRQRNHDGAPVEGAGNTPAGLRGGGGGGGQANPSGTGEGQGGKGTGWEKGGVHGKGGGWRGRKGQKG